MPTAYCAALAKQFLDASYLTAWAAHCNSIEVGRVIASRNAGRPRRSRAQEVHGKPAHQEKRVRHYMRELGTARGMHGPLDTALFCMVANQSRHEF